MSSDPILPPDSNPEPSIPPQVLPPASSILPPASTGTVKNGTGLAPNVAAGLSVLTGGIGGIVFLVIEKRDPFVRFWAMQSIFFGVGMLVLNIAVSILLGILGHIIGFLVFIFYLAYAIVCLGILALWIIMMIKAFDGKEWEIPVIGPMARQQLAKMPPV